MVQEQQIGLEIGTGGRRTTTSSGAGATIPGLRRASGTAGGAGDFKYAKN